MRNAHFYDNAYLLVKLHTFLNSPQMGRCLFQISKSIIRYQLAVINTVNNGLGKIIAIELYHCTPKIL